MIALHIWGVDLPNHPLHNVALVLRPELQGVRERPSSGLELIAGVRE